ncbi:eyes absent homolog isoform X2 [Malania oleifera]|uniref:eyes absent homolog isoform X2 n=1 Tax=Malania oleifera TaxID=397392 RepID=UPI0025ADD1E6|nr:eyes absent homolog isoform X2 [Malania oleifera]
MDDLIGGNSTVSVQKTEVSAKKSIDRKMNVYIWDMDETLVLLKSLLNGTYAEAFNGVKDVQKGVEVGKMWEKHILQVCDDYFFYEQIENYNRPSLDAFVEYDDGMDLSDYDFNQDGFSTLSDDSDKRKLAYRHRAIAYKYKQGLPGILDQESVKLLDDLYDMTDSYTDRWLSSGGIRVSNNCVTSADGATENVAATVQHVNVLVTSGSLIPSLVKCLLFRLDVLITHGNVYSSWEVGKLQCFLQIQDRFNSPNTQFCVIGDGWEECEAAQAMKWPFVKIDPRPGGGHRFPGLTVRTLGYYFSVVYGNPDDEVEEG